MIPFRKKKKRLIIVSNRLPFHRMRDEMGNLVWEKAAGGLITAMEPILYDAGGIWLGWDGFTSDGGGSGKVELIDVNTIATATPEGMAREGRTYKLGCVPVNESEMEEYYNRFSNGTLWALFHYFFEKCDIDHAAWKAYCRINERFAEYIHKVAAPDDLVWIQDFHLLMVPHYLRKMRPSQEMHFFLHIPFPHRDIFSILPWEGQILESMLCCDTVGFHHKQYLRNFLDEVEAYKKERAVHGWKATSRPRETLFYVNPISIDFDLIDRTSRKKEVIERKKEIRAKINCPKLILGVDRMDYSKGIKKRLLGVEALLDAHPELREKFFYYQLVIPSREGVDAYKALKKEVEELIGRINGKFAVGLWSPVHYNYGTVPFEELVALYSAADIALVTPLRDGMNLVCKEYVAAHSDGDGVLVLSKFAGAIAEIKNCISVNPYSVEDIAQAVQKALQMHEGERRTRMERMRKNIMANNIMTWINKCQGYFARAHKGFIR